MDLRVDRWIGRVALLLVLLASSTSSLAAAQACPAGKSCFYVPPGLPLEASHSAVGSRLFDLVLSSPVRTVTGTYSIGGAAAVSFSVSPGASTRIPLTGESGPASAYGAPEQKGVYLEADSPDLTVDHRETFDSEQYSETIKRDAIALGSRFRLGGYTLNREGRPDAGIDAVLIYAPTGGTVTITAPPGATLPFWSGSATAVYTATLTAGQTLAVRTEVAKDLDGALLTSSLPVSVSSGGRGWSTPGSCGDDGMDGLVPVSALGTEYVVRLPTGSSILGAESRVAVIADVDATEVRVDGVLVATLVAGGHYDFQPITVSYVQTSTPALVWMNGSLAGCELDTVLIPPVSFRPALTELSLDFNVLTSAQLPPGEMAILIATGDVGSIRLGGAVPTLTSSVTVPGRAALSYVRFNVSSGDTNVRAGSDFQALLATRTSPSGLLAYYNPYRIPGCGDGGIDPGETCDDGDLIAGDGCSASCTVEPGYACSGAPSTCAPTCGDSQLGAPVETCDDGNAVAGDGCNSNCRHEVRISTPAEASRSNDATPTITGTSDPGIPVSVSIGTTTGNVSADSTGAWTYTHTTALPDGAYTITATGTDGRGGMSSATRSFSIDTSTTLVISAPTANAITMDTTPTLSGTGEVGATVTVGIDGNSVGTAVVAADGSWTLTVATPLTPGSKVVSAVSTDLTNNTGMATPVSFVIDTDTTLTIAAPANNAVVNSATPTVSGSSEPGSTVSLMLTDSKGAVVTATATTAADGSWSVAIGTPLASGSVSVMARAMDSAGNMAQASSTFIVDASTSVSILVPAEGGVVGSPTPLVTGIGEPGAKVVLSLDGVPAGNADVQADGSWSVGITLATPGPHRVSVRATDTLGNEAQDENAFTYDPSQTDTDGDGRPDRDECKSSPCVDTDGDGLTDERDPDDDGDGLPTASECSETPCRDTDGDGKPNYLDPDDDHDGRPTADERNQDGTTRDTDHDGLPDHLDPDDDGDGLSTRVECAAAPCPDTDGDSTPDWLDPDDDNDGVPTARERDDGIRFGNNDTDGDGLVAWHDPDANGNGAPDGVDGLGDGDGDGITDYSDTDTPPSGGSITDEGFEIAGGGGCSAARGGGGAGDALGALCLALAGLTLRRRRARESRGS